MLAALLPGYTAIAGVAVDQPGEGGTRRRFGNMILSRLPVLQAYRHLLPYPADHDVPSMPRVAVEAVVERGVRRRARDHHAPRVLLAAQARGAGRGAARDLRRGPRAMRATRAIVAADEGPYQALPAAGATRSSPATSISSPTTRCTRGMGAPFDDGTPPLARRLAASRIPARRTPPRSRSTKRDPGEPELHCDFIFVSEDLVPRVSRGSGRHARRRCPITSR